MSAAPQRAPSGASPFRHPAWPARLRRRGQTVVFMILGFTALAFMILFIVDLHRIIQRKDQSQNAGDAAALAAARWQGATLNLVGELNLLHVLALANGDTAAVDAITNMQARLCFTGPVTALFASQVAAKNNRMYVDPDMTALLTDHAALIRSTYGETFGGDQPRFPEPWPGAWSDYADMLDGVAALGIAAGPDNADFFLDPSSGHLLLEKAFYEAVLGRNWCWFHFNAPGLLDSYSSYRDWPPIPDPDRSDFADSEIFGVGLRPFETRLNLLFTAPALAALITDAGLGPATAEQLSATNVLEVSEIWYGFNPSRWSDWSLMRADGEDSFPITGVVRPEYDYSGADTVVRVNASVERMTPGADGGSRNDSVIWTAAAKPLGYLDAEGQKRRPDSAASYALPAFRDVRLIPIDAASGANRSSADAEWVRHIHEHLPAYLREGPPANACRYCRALSTWEVDAFRTEGSDWLSVNSGLCRRPSGGGGRRGGGTRRGH